MIDRYAVLGNPIAHSRSPQIHKMFAEQTGQNISYVAIESPLNGFAATVNQLRDEGFKGCNVTVPFKQEASRLAELTARALDAQAVNTLIFDHGKIIGDNTDGIGLVNDIKKNLKQELKGKRILLIGAGGAAYGVLHPLLLASRTSLVIYNRTLEKASDLKNSIDKHDHLSSKLIQVIEFGRLGDLRFDIVINATSAGLTDSEIPLSPNCFLPGSLAYDMMYGQDTPFMKFAREHGASIVSDGLGMLVEQAAESFFIWRGVRPLTAPVISSLRKA